MRTLKKIYLVSFLLGSLLLSVLFTQAQKVKSNESVSTVNSIDISAGADVFTCNENEFITSGASPSNVPTIWRTSGDGTFDNPQSLHAVYSPGEHDNTNGSVTLYLVVFSMGGNGNEVIYDEMILHLNNCTAIDPLIKEF